MTQGYIPPPPAGLVLTTTAASSLAGGIKALVYGRSGAGKTRLCGTAPAPIILSAEKGLLSLRDQNIPVLEINTLDDLNRAHDWLIGPAGANYYTVCLDSITEIGEKVLANAKKGNKDGRAAYGVLIDQMTQIIKAYRDLPGKCVVMTAKTEFMKDEMSGITRWAPAMPGAKLAQQLPYLFDEVFYLGTNKDAEGKDYRYLQTRVDLQYEAKDRSGSLDHFEFPDLTHVFNKIYGVA